LKRKLDVSTHLINEYDAVFVSSFDALMASCVSSVAYVPYPAVEKPVALKHWESTGFVWNGYHEYALRGQDIHAVPAVHTIISLPHLALTTNDINSVACLSHPVGEMVELQRSTLLVGPFHYYRRGRVLSELRSDFPYSHCYDDINCTSFERGVKWPHKVTLRKYVQVNGAWRGQACLPCNLSDVRHTIVYWIDGLTVRWEFLTPEVWCKVSDQCRDLFSLASKEGHVSAVYVPGSKAIVTHVPVSWDKLQVEDMLGSSASQVPGGWTGSISSRRLDPLRFWDMSAQSGASLWFMQNGGHSFHFSILVDGSRTVLKGKSAQSFYLSITTISKPQFLCADINALYDIDSTGPFCRGTNLVTHDRSGRPKRNVRSSKKKK